MRQHRHQWQELNQLQREMNNLFQRRLERDEEAAAWSWNPPVDVYEDRERYLLLAEVPGIDPAKVDLRIEDNRLMLQGVRELEFAESKENYQHVERQYGTFSRTFTLPSMVAVAEIQAEYRHGVLRITIPKRPEAQVKQITVKVAD